MCMFYDAWLFHAGRIQWTEFDEPLTFRLQQIETGVTGVILPSHQSNMHQCKRFYWDVCPFLHCNCIVLFSCGWKKTWPMESGVSCRDSRWWDCKSSPVRSPISLLLPLSLTFVCIDKTVSASLYCFAVVYICIPFLGISMQNIYSVQLLNSNNCFYPSSLSVVAFLLHRISLPPASPWLWMSPWAR